RPRGGYHGLHFGRRSRRDDKEVRGGTSGGTEDKGIRMVSGQLERRAAADEEVAGRGGARQAGIHEQRRRPYGVAQHEGAGGIGIQTGYEGGGRFHRRGRERRNERSDI